MRKTFCVAQLIFGVIWPFPAMLVGQVTDLDPFGGWPGKQFEATGFFHLQETEDRWWLATPEGNAFLIHGIDHVSEALTNRDYNRAFWNRSWGLSATADAQTRGKAFYRKLAEDRAYLGFNALYTLDPPLGTNVSPYITRALSIHNEYWRRHNFRKQVPPWSEDNFVDVFSQEFVEAVEATGKQMVAERRQTDPWLIAWILTDSPVLVPYEARPFPPGFYHKPIPATTTWPVRLRNLGADAPGKQAYVELMRKRYGDSIELFNTNYNTAFQSWEDLTNAEDWRHDIDINGNINEERDNHAFLLAILDKAWGTQVEVLRKYDSNHMIWGDTLNLNSPLTDEIIQLYAKHFPVIVYQYYGATWEDHQRVMDRIRRLTGGKPVFCADSSWSVCQPPHMPDTLGPQCANYTIVADKMEQAYREAFARRDVIGWGWCGWMDQWEIAEPVKQHGGVQDAFGNWHQPLADRMAKLGREMYQIATP